MENYKLDDSNNPLGTTHNSKSNKVGSIINSYASPAVIEAEKQSVEQLSGQGLNETAIEDQPNDSRGVTEDPHFPTFSENETEEHQRPHHKQKISLKKIWLNSGVYAFFKVWLNLNRWGIFLYLIIIAASFAFFVYNVRKVNSLLSDISTLNKEKIELSGKNKILQVKIVALQSPERIDKIAVEQLGFIKTTEAPFYIKKNR